MNLFLINILLALVWAMATSRLSLGNFFIGFVLGYVFLWFLFRSKDRSNYFARVPRVASFALRYLWDLLLANLRVAHDVVTPTHFMRPAVIAIPLDAKTDIEITLLANLLTLTPGSLSLDVSPDRSKLYIHAMYVDKDAETYQKSVKENLEQRVLKLVR